MAQIQPIAAIVAKLEGGWQINPNDSGNYNSQHVLVGSKYGVTPIVYEQFFGKVPTAQDMQNLSLEQFEMVFKKYYLAWQGDLINNQSICNFLCDWFYNSGYYAITCPQNILGVPADGIVGNGTITALNNANQEEFFNKIKAARYSFINSIIAHNPSQEVFKNGWYSRINSFNFQA